MCIFCDIVEGKCPSYKIYEDEDTYVFLSIAKDAVGHTLVIPKKHFESTLDIDNETFMKVMSTVKKEANHYVDNCGYTGVNILNASGVSAGQSVYHLHYHIIPRKEDDGMDWWPQLEETPYDFEKVCEKLKLTK